MEPLGLSRDYDRDPFPQSSLSTSGSRFLSSRL